MIDLNEFQQYMALGGGIDQMDVGNLGKRKSSATGPDERNYNIQSLDRGGKITDPRFRPPANFLDEDRKSDLEDFEDDLNEQNIMNMGIMCEGEQNFEVSDDEKQND